MAGSSSGRRRRRKRAARESPFDDFGPQAVNPDRSCRLDDDGGLWVTSSNGEGDVVFSERRSLIFKRMRIVRGCDAKRNTLIYLVYSDKPIEGSPKNSTSTVPIAPWAGEPAPRCADFVKAWVKVMELDRFDLR